LIKKGPDNAIYILPDAKIKNKTYFSAAKTAIKDHLYREKEITLFHNPSLKLYSRAGESERDFEARCQVTADEMADKDADKLRRTLAGGLLGGLLGGRSSTRSITSGIRRSQSKGRMAAKAEERLKTAENRYEALIDDREELEETLADDLMEIQDEWSEKISDIDSMTVGLEKADISIDDLTLIWIPVE